MPPAYYLVIGTSPREGADLIRRNRTGRITSCNASGVSDADLVCYHEPSPWHSMWSRRQLLSVPGGGSRGTGKE